jgi:WD40 repeat protein
MKKWVFLAICVVLNMHASDKKSMNADSESQDQKKSNDCVAYAPTPIFQSNESCNTIRFLPNNETFVVDNFRGLSFYSVKNNSKCTISADKGQIQCIDCNDRSLAAADDVGAITLWTLNSIYTQAAHWKGAVNEIAAIKLDQKGERVAVGGLQDGKIALYSIETQQELFSGYAHEKSRYLKDLVWLHDNTTLAVLQPSGWHDGSVSLWDTREKKLVATVPAYNSGAFGNSQLVCTADDTIIWSDYRVLRAWDKRSQKTRDMAILPSVEHSGRKLNYYTSIALSHDDTVLAALLLGNRCDFFDWRTGKKIQSLPVQTDFNYCVAFSPKSDMIATTVIKQSNLSKPSDGIRVYEREKEKIS